MIFFMVMPAMIGGFGNWMVPLMIGAPRHGVPAHEQHLVLAAAGLLRSAAAVHLRRGRAGANGVGTGWTLYARCPTSGHPGPAGRFRHSVDPSRRAHRSSAPFNFITTIFNMRAPGMTLPQDALFVWSILVTVFLVLLALRCSPGAITMLLTDRISAPPLRRRRRRRSGAVPAPVLVLRHPESTS